MSQLPWPESPPVGRAVYPDEYLNYWADRYVAAGVGIRGVTLMQYLANPRRYDDGDTSFDPLPLLGRQRRIQRHLLDLELQESARQTLQPGQALDLAWITRRAESGVAELPRRNGRIFEPLHHKTHPRNRLANFSNRQGTRR